GNRVSRLEEPAQHRRAGRQVLDPLSRPLRLQLRARNAPDLLRVRLEEHQEQTPAESVRDPLLKRVDVSIRKHPPANIAEHDQDPFKDPELGERVDRLEWIVKKLFPEKDPRHSWTAQEFLAKNTVPDLPHLLRFREKAVATHIKTKSLVTLGPGNPTD